MDENDITIKEINHKFVVTDKVSTIAIGEVVDTYLVQKSALPTIVAPTIEPSTKFTSAMATSKVIIALELATKLYPHPSNVVCLTVPKSLVADAAIKKGTLTLVPATHSLKIMDELRPCTFTCRVGGVKCELTRCVDDDMTVPAWYCNTTHDKKDVNMKVTTVSVDINAGIEGEGGKHYKSNSNIDIPVIVNTRAVKVGETLWLPAAAKESTKRRFDVI